MSSVAKARPKRRARASSNAYLRLYGGDYLRDTMGNTAAQDGIYLRLLIHYWHSQRPLPADPIKLEGIARVRDDLERAALATVVSEFFYKRGKRLLQKRMESELDFFRNRSRVNSASGRKGGEKSAETKKKRQANAKQTLDTRSSERVAHPTPAPSKGEVNPTSPLNPLRGDGQARAPETDLAGERPEPDKPTAPSETAYREAMRKRYGVDPGPLNKKQRGQLAMMLARIPKQDAPAIVAHYVAMDGQRGSLYANASHPVDLLLRDCEAIRLAWQTKDVAKSGGPPWYRVEYPQRTEEYVRRGREYQLPIPSRGSSSDDWAAFFAAVWVRAEPGKPWHDATNAVMSGLVEQARESLGHLRRVK